MKKPKTLILDRFHLVFDPVLWVLLDQLFGWFWTCFQLLVYEPFLLPVCWRSHNWAQSFSFMNKTEVSCVKLDKMMKWILQADALLQGLQGQDYIWVFEQNQKWFQVMTGCWWLQSSRKSKPGALLPPSLVFLCNQPLASSLLHMKLFSKAEAKINQFWC